MVVGVTLVAVAAASTFAPIRNREPSADLNSDPVA